MGIGGKRRRGDVNRKTGAGELEVCVEEDGGGTVEMRRAKYSGARV